MTHRNDATPSMRLGRTAAAALFALLLLAGLAACSSGDSNDSNVNAGTKKPPAEVDDSDEDDGGSSGGGSIDEETLEEAEEVSLTNLSDLCNLLTLERAQQIEPEVESEDPDDIEQPGYQANYWCTWAQPRTLVEPGDDGYDRALRQVTITEAEDTPWEQVLAAKGAPELVEGLGAAAVFTVQPFGGGYGGDAGLAVLVVSEDGTRQTSFLIQAYAFVCSGTDPDSCEPDMDYVSNPELKERMIAVGQEIAADLQQLLDSCADVQGSVEPGETCA